MHPKGLLKTTNNLLEALTGLDYVQFLCMKSLIFDELLFSSACIQHKDMTNRASLQQGDTRNMHKHHTTPHLQSITQQNIHVFYF